VTDLTPEQQLADAVAALAQAERANAAKSRFLAAASHDLRQPLQALRLLNAALQEYLMTDDMALNIVRDSDRALEVMDRLLGSLLDISKIDSGVVVPDLRDFTITDIFNDLRGDFARLAREKNLDFRVVPSTRIVHTDRVMIDAILRNLLSNAVRYTSAGKIMLGCRMAGAAIRIEVWDTGIGIPADQIGNIFDAFYQIGAPERDNRQGLGLGLSIVQGYARLLRHPLRVRSRPGAGSVFSIELPLGTYAAADATRRDDSHQGAAWNMRDRHVLLIEDDEQALDAMQTLLGAWAMRVLGVRSGAEAAQSLTQNKFMPDIVLTDFRLGNGETGSDAIDRIRPIIGDRVPVIFITGDSMMEVRAALGGRYVYLLQKPVAPSKLRVLIRNLLKA